MFLHQRKVFIVAHPVSLLKSIYTKLPSAWVSQCLHRTAKALETRTHYWWFQPFPGEWVEQKGPPVTVLVFFWKVHQHGCHVFCLNCLLGMVENHQFSSLMDCLSSRPSQTITQDLTARRLPKPTFDSSRRNKILCS